MSTPNTPRKVKFRIVIPKLKSAGYIEDVETLDVLCILTSGTSPKWYFVEPAFNNEMQQCLVLNAPDIITGIIKSDTTLTIQYESKGNQCEFTFDI